MSAPTKKRETAAQRAEREWAELLAEAEAAGYVSPYPAPGQALVVDIEFRCEGCSKTPYVSMQGEFWCPYRLCSEYQIVNRIEVES